MMGRLLAWVSGLLALHLGSVLAFFLLTPYSKMAHGFYRLAALVREAARQREAAERATATTPAGAIAAENRT